MSEEIFNDDGVNQAIDDVMFSVETPLFDLLRAIWPYHEETAQWLLLAQTRNFVKSYSEARNEGITVAEGVSMEASVELALRHAFATVLHNPNVQAMIREVLRDMGGMPQ